MKHRLAARGYVVHAIFQPLSYYNRKGTITKPLASSQSLGMVVTWDYLRALCVYVSDDFTDHTSNTLPLAEVMPPPIQPPSYMTGPRVALGPEMNPAQVYQKERHVLMNDEI